MNMMFWFLFLVTLLATYTDVRSHKIYNWLTLPALLVVIGWVFLMGNTDVFIQHGISLTFMFLVSLLLFRFGRMGGGDVKLLWVLAAAFPIFDFINVLLTIFVVGGLYAIVQMSVFSKNKNVPYAIPIFFGLLIYGYLNGFMMIF